MRIIEWMFPTIELDPCVFEEFMDDVIDDVYASIKFGIDEHVDVVYTVSEHDRMCLVMVRNAPWSNSKIHEVWYRTVDKMKEIGIGICVNRNLFGRVNGVAIDYTNKNRPRDKKDFRIWSRNVGLAI